MCCMVNVCVGVTLFASVCFDLLRGSVGLCLFSLIWDGGGVFSGVWCDIE